MVSFPQVFHQTTVNNSRLPHTSHIPRSFHPDSITRTILCEQYKSFSSSLCSFLQSPVTSSLLGANYLINSLFSNTLILHLSSNAIDQVLHPYNTTGRIIFLYIWSRKVWITNFFLLIPCLLQSVRRHLVTFVSVVLETCRRYFQ